MITFLYSEKFSGVFMKFWWNFKNTPYPNTSWIFCFHVKLQQKVETLVKHGALVKHLIGLKSINFQWNNDISKRVLLQDCSLICENSFNWLSHCKVKNLQCFEYFLSKLRNYVDIAIFVNPQLYFAFYEMLPKCDKKQIFY